MKQKSKKSGGIRPISFNPDALSFKEQTFAVGQLEDSDLPLAVTMSVR